jgi:hypothetical protein
LGFVVLYLSGAISQQWTQFGEGILVLSLFLFVPGAACALVGLLLRIRERQHPDVKGE